MKINITKPWITEKEVEYVSDAVRIAWGDNADKYNNLFEKAFSQYLDVKYAISLPSCTSAIHLALASLNIGKGDEVIIPDITWIGSAAPITYVNACPVFADIDEKTWCLSTDSFESLITKNTKVVIPVDLYGNISEIDKIVDIANDNDIIVIEDAAEAIGSEIMLNNEIKKAGSVGEIGVFSFHASKTITTGEGGMLVTNNRKLYDRCLFLRNHGRSIENFKMFQNTEVAYKYRMSNLQAALGLAQIERVDELVNKKRLIFNLYNKELKNLIKDNILYMNCEPYNVKNTYWMVTVVINHKLNIKKEFVIEKMNQKEIDCRPFFYPLSSLDAYSKLRNVKEFQKNNKVSYEISPYGINLPSGMDMNKEKIHYVCNNLKNIIDLVIN